MKLIRCHIENFGKLSDFTYDFSEGCNTICEENGWGKSTLASFLRVMLCGFRNEIRWKMRGRDMRLGRREYTAENYNLKVTEKCILCEEFLEIKRRRMNFS